MIIKRKVKDYILLALCLILCFILLVQVDWISNYVPDGIAGLIIVIGYIVLVGAVSLYLIYKIIA